MFTITKERVLEAASKCETAKETLKTLFPEVFKSEEKTFFRNDILSNDEKTKYGFNRSVLVCDSSRGSYNWVLAFPHGGDTGNEFELSYRYNWTIDGDKLIATKK